MDNPKKHTDRMLPLAKNDPVYTLCKLAYEIIEAQKHIEENIARLDFVASGLTTSDTIKRETKRFGKKNR